MILAPSPLLGRLQRGKMELPLWHKTHETRVLKAKTPSKLNMQAQHSKQEF
jgi:hypothetical protein